MHREFVPQPDGGGDRAESSGGWDGASERGAGASGFCDEDDEADAGGGQIFDRGAGLQGIGQELWEEAEIVINMSGRPREAAFREWDKVDDWDVDDPYGEDAVGYQRICEDIEGSVEELAEKLRRAEFPCISEVDSS